MRDWRFITMEQDYVETRIKYTDERDEIYNNAHIPLYHCPDLLIEPDDNEVRFRIYEEV